MTPFLEDEDDTTEAHERRIARCRTCRAEIVWLKTAAGRTMPVDAHSVLPEDDEFDRERHVSHFATCATGRRHRTGEGAGAHGRLTT